MTALADVSVGAIDRTEARLAAVAFVVLMFVRPLHWADVGGMFVIGALILAKSWREFRGAGRIFGRRASDADTGTFPVPPIPPGSLPVGPAT